MHTLYCYVDGSDNQAIEPVLVDAFRALVSDWAQYCAVFVNHQHERKPDLAPDDLNDWFIGLNLPLPCVSQSQIEQLVLFAKALAGATGRDFVVGISLPSGLCEDLVFLDANADETEGLRLYTRLEAVLHGA